MYIAQQCMYHTIRRNFLKYQPCACWVTLSMVASFFFVRKLLIPAVKGSGVGETRRLEGMSSFFSFLPFFTGFGVENGRGRKWFALTILHTE